MSANRVAITGIGILSCLGNNLADVIEYLKIGKSGITFQEEWKNLSFRSQVCGRVKNYESLLDNISLKMRNSMSEVALFCSLAAQLAVKDSKLDEKTLREAGTGCLVGSGFTSGQTIWSVFEKMTKGKANRAGPYAVLKSMSSTVSANISHLIPIGGRSYSIGSACSTACHNIGHAFELIQSGHLDRALAGGGEHIESVVSAAFNAMRLALSCKYNDSPRKASRPYDRDRDGFVLSEGAGILVLENMEAAQKRGANIYGEILGYAANTDGFDLIYPDPKGRAASECMLKAIESGGKAPKDVDYINTHGTSTVAGDVAEVSAIKNVFKENIPWFSSTKSMGGHTIGASGAIEIIHCLAMLKENFIAPSINVDNVDPHLEGMPINVEARNQALKTVLSNSFGFGGTNASVLLGKV